MKIIVVLIGADNVECLLFKCLDRRCTGWRRLLTGKYRCPKMALWNIVRRLFVCLVISCLTVLAFLTQSTLLQKHSR